MDILGGINARRIASDMRLILLSSYFDRLGDRNKSDSLNLSARSIVIRELDGLTDQLIWYEINYTSSINKEDWNNRSFTSEVNHSLFAGDDYLVNGDLPTTLNLQ